MPKHAFLDKNIVLHTKIEMDDAGFQKFPGLLSGSLASAEAMFVDTHLVDYEKTSQFISNTFLPAIKSVMQWENPVVTKFRLSNANNSTDAGAFHRDLNPRRLMEVPAYTCLVYMDDADMQLIPGSHKWIAVNPLRAIREYNSAINVHLAPGDVLIFNSFVVHRGFFRFKQVQRRLLQCFEVYPTLDLMSTYAPLKKNGRKTQCTVYFSNHHETSHDTGCQRLH